MLDEEFIEITESCLTMAEAARKLGISLKSFRKRAKKLGVYKPNQGGKGSKQISRPKISLEDIFSNKVPFQSYKLKQRLYKANLKKNQCEICGISEWNNLPIECHLDHIDGNKFNNALENLRIICPNCHSQSETYCFKGGRKYRED